MEQYVISCEIVETSGKDLKAAAKQAEEEEAVAKQAEVEEAVAKQAAAGASEDEGDEEDLTALEYLKKYKELSPDDVEVILKFPVVRTPFTDTDTYKALSSDPDATQDDIDKAEEEHEAHLDWRTRFCDWVRCEYDAKGYVAVSDAYIARRIAIEDYSRKLLEELAEELADSSDSDDDDEAGLEEELAAH